MLNPQRARAKVGHRVIYRDGDQEARGVIRRVGTYVVYVRFDGEFESRAVFPDELTLEEES